MSKYAIKFTQPTLAQQHSKEEVDINNIMKRYIKTGVIDHVTKYKPQYTENTMQDYQTSQNIIIKADNMFQELPSQVRKQFDNDPGRFLEFVSDEKNHDKLAEMGLNNAPPAERTAETKEPTTKTKTKKTAVPPNSEPTPTEEDA